MKVRETMQICLDFQNYWHAGSGQSSGHHLDALCQKDASGLPFVSGKQLKGLLRHAVRRAEDWGWYDEQKAPLDLNNRLEDLLFGSANQSEGRFETEPSMVYVENAVLPPAEHDYLAAPSSSALKAQLYVDMYNTAIDENTGTVKAHSLRGIELALPVNLFACLYFKPSSMNPAVRKEQEILFKQDLVASIIEQALPLLDLCGAHRSRGLGEVVVRSVQVQG